MLEARRSRHATVNAVLALGLTILPLGVGYAGDKISLACLGTMRVERGDQSSSGTPIGASLAVDLDEGLVTTTIGTTPLTFTLTELTENVVVFGGESDRSAGLGRIDRVSGFTILTIKNEGESDRVFELTCKPAKPLF
jgi:hypothetical protein